MTQRQQRIVSWLRAAEAHGFEGHHHLTDWPCVPELGVLACRAEESTWVAEMVYKGMAGSPQAAVLARSSCAGCQQLARELRQLVENSRQGQLPFP